MQKRSPYLSSFFFLSVLSVFLLLLSTAGATEPLRSIFQSTLLPFQRAIFTAYADVNSNEKSLVKEDEQVRLLQTKIDEQEREIKALRDQFKISEPPSQNLLPAEIVGYESFVSGVGNPERITIDKGSRNGVKVGQMVVVGDILFGKIVKTSHNLSIVEVSTKKGFSITARTSGTNALGVIKGQGSSLLLDNVILSESLKKDDFVVTKGSLNSEGIGSPPGLVLGKIVSVDKKPSSLFQTAEVAPLLDSSRVTMVFVLLP